MKSELAKREREILGMILKEHTSQDIADILNLSVHTIDTHRKNILRKTRSKTIVSLIKYSIKAGMMDGYFYKTKNPKPKKAS